MRVQLPAVTGKALCSEPTSRQSTLRDMQYQLHLQFMVPVLLPTVYQQYLAGIHFTPGRYFPFEFVRRVLASSVSVEFKARAGCSTALTDMPAATQEDLDTSELIHQAAAAGISYEDIHKHEYQRCGGRHDLRAGSIETLRIGEAHRRLANWRPIDFEGVVMRGLPQLCDAPNRETGHPGCG